MRDEQYDTIALRPATVKLPIVSRAHHAGVLVHDQMQTTAGPSAKRGLARAHRHFPSDSPARGYYENIFRAAVAKRDERFAAAAGELACGSA